MRAETFQGRRAAGLETLIHPISEGSCGKSFLRILVTRGTAARQER